jgi:hypothetical protein
MIVYFEMVYELTQLLTKPADSNQHLVVSIGCEACFQSQQ